MDKITHEVRLVYCIPYSNRNKELHHALSQEEVFLQWHQEAFAS